MGYYTPKKFWFGTAPFVSPTPNIPSDPGKMQWIDAPIQGADMSTSDWGSTNVFLNGGAHVSQSRGSYKSYSFEWRESSSPQTVSMIQGYRNGSYGRGLIHFLTPDAYESNALPERWAHPGLSLGVEGRHLPVFKKSGSAYQLAQDPSVTGTVTPQNDWNLPLTSLQYDLSSAMLRPDTAVVRNSGMVFVPIPAGFYALINAWGSEGGIILSTTTGDAPIFRPFSANAYEDAGFSDSLTPLTSVTGGLFLGLATETDALSISALSVKLISREEVLPNFNIEGLRKLVTRRGLWNSGMGNSGTRFAPGGITMNYNSPVGGGRMGFAASFTEVGDSLR